MHLYFRPKLLEQAQLQLVVESRDPAKSVYHVQLERFVSTTDRQSRQSNIPVLPCVCFPCSKP
jgi:hypothetical protein